jgi:hypothetical protein
MRTEYYPRSFFFVYRNSPIELSAQASYRLRLLKAWQAMMENGLCSRRAADALHLSRATL